MTGRALVELESATVHFRQRHGLRHRPGVVHAVDGVSLSVEQGETLGVVGETGCGKSTLGRAILGLVRLTAGRVLVEGRAARAGRRPGAEARRLGLQMVFQDPAGSLNPRRTVGLAIAESLS